MAVFITTVAFVLSGAAIAALLGIFFVGLMEAVPDLFGSQDCEYLDRLERKEDK